MKFELLTSLKAQMTTPNVLKTPKYTLQFCGKGEKVPAAGEYMLPIQIHTCPDNFSTVEYFDVSTAISLSILLTYSMDLYFCFLRT
jgi:biotin---protein ligase